MHNAVLDRSLDALGAVRKHIAFSETLRAQIGAGVIRCKSLGAPCFDVDSLVGSAADTTNWKIIDHCAAITRIYALFESFVLDILREYITFLSSSYTLTDLGADFRSKYTRGLGQILLDHEKQRFQGIDITSLIKSASDAVSDQQGYHLEPEALLRAEQNLRMQELQRLFAQCGLRDLERWVTTHPTIEAFFADQARLSETASSELKQIIQYRNEAAHGEVIEVLGHEVLVEFTQFLEALCRSLLDLVQYDTLRRAKALGRAKAVGTVVHRYGGGVVIIRSKDATVSVGEQLYVWGKGQTMTVVVESIQLEGSDLPTITTSEEVDIGLKIGLRPKIGSELVKFN